MGADPTEHFNEAAARPDVVADMVARLDAHVAAGYVQPQSNKYHADALPLFHGGVWAPWL